jgi:hypothetical protein
MVRQFTVGAASFAITAFLIVVSSSVPGSAFFA